MGKLDNNNQHFFHQFPVTKGVSEVVTHIKKALGDNKPTFLVVSGDLTCQGDHDNEHLEAVTTLHALCTAVGIDDRRRVFIVPGNHDIDRNAPTQERMTKHNERFMQAFYGGDPRLGEANGGMPLGEYVPPRAFANKVNETKNRWIFPFIEEYGVLFIPLYSADPTVDQKLPVWLKNMLRSKANLWAFDRGLISQEQLEAVDTELQVLRPGTSVLRVVIFHHNPVPIKRSGIRSDDHYLAETNLLANGAEVIERLREWEVSLVLHGHRHQNSVLAPLPFEPPPGAPSGSVRNEMRYTNLVIVGAPSVGLSMMALGTQPTDGPARPPLDWLGFNLIEVQHWKHGIRGHLRRFGSKPGTQFRFIEKPSSVLTFSSPNDRPVEIMTAAEGLQELGRQILDSRGGITILHYHPTAIWEESTEGAGLKVATVVNPFTILWHPVFEDSTILKGLAELAYPGQAHQQWMTETRTVLQQCLNEGFYVQRFLHTLMRVRGAVHDALKNPSGVPPKNAFLRHVVGMCRGDTRLGNYSLELLMLACNSEFFVKKCVYFWPPNRSATSGAQSDPSKWLRDKFNWILESASTCRLLNNFHLAWLPFSIAGHFGQSVVSVALEPPREGESIPTTILIGYGEDLSEHEDFAVMCLRGRYAEHLAGGVLGRDIRALMRKLIYPLTARLLRDFPIFRNCTLYIGNLEILGTIYGINGVSQNGLAERFGASVDPKPTIDLPRLRDLYHWVLGANAAYGELNIPWDKDDYDFLEGCLNRISPRANAK